MAKLSVELNRYFFEESRAEKVTLSEILTLAGDSIFGFLFVILALPSALPVPAPGYSIPFGVGMFVLAFQLILGRNLPWLPDKIMNGSMSLEKVQSFLSKGLPWLQKIEALTKPRFSYVCNSVTGRILVGLAIAFMAVLMMIPIPGTNTVPAIGIFITGLGLVEEDGLISLLGLMICAVGATISISILIGVVWGGSSLIDILKQKLAN